MYPRMAVNGVFNSCETSASICRRSAIGVRSASSRSELLRHLVERPADARDLVSAVVGRARGEVPTSQAVRGLFDRPEPSAGGREDHHGGEHGRRYQESVLGSDRVRRLRAARAGGGGGRTNKPSPDLLPPESTVGDYRGGQIEDNGVG